MFPTEALYFVIIDWVLLFICHWSLSCSYMSVQYIKGAILFYRHTQVLQSCKCLRVDRHSGSLWVSGCLINRECQTVWWIVSGCLMNRVRLSDESWVSGCLMNHDGQAVWWIVSFRLSDKSRVSGYLMNRVRLSDESWVSGCLMNRKFQAVW
jgi:hypothetical protein